MRRELSNRVQFSCIRALRRACAWDDRPDRRLRHCRAVAGRHEAHPHPRLGGNHHGLGIGADECRRRIEKIRPIAKLGAQWPPVGRLEDQERVGGEVGGLVDGGGG